MTIKGFRAQSGFTLIELLVVVVILGILAAGAVAVFNGTTQKARDGVRKNDLATIQGSIELYKIDNNGVAPVISTTETLFEAQLVPSYLQAMPLDPASTGNSYAYHQDTATTSLYKLYGNKETAPAVVAGIIYGTSTHASTVAKANCTDGSIVTNDCETAGTSFGREWGCGTLANLACGD